MFGPDAVELLLNAVHLFQSPQNRIGLEHEKRWATRLREFVINSLFAHRPFAIFNFLVSDPFILILPDPLLLQVMTDTLSFLPPNRSDWYTPKQTNPFPFTMTCLFMGYSFKEEDVYSTSSCYPQTFNMEFDRADNNDGITVLDITDIEKIRYCFVNIHSKSDPRAWGNIKSSGAPSMIPLSTFEYMKAYGHEQEHFERDWKEWIRQLSKLNLIDSRTLNSVWPRNT